MFVAFSQRPMRMKSEQACGLYTCPHMLMLIAEMPLGIQTLAKVVSAQKKS